MPEPTNSTPPAAQPKGPGLNPDLRQHVDRTYSDSQHGSDPMATVSVKKSGPAVWPLIWAVVTIAMIVLTLWLVFG